MQDTHIDESLKPASLELLKQTCETANIPLDRAYVTHPLMQSLFAGDRIIVDIYYQDTYACIRKAVAGDAPVTATQTEHTDNLTETSADDVFSQWLTEYTEVRWWDVRAGCIYKEQTPNIVVLIAVVCGGEVLDRMKQHIKALT